MRAKPDDCIGCPLYGDGRGFVPDEIVEGAETLILMQNPGEDEEAQERPAVGKTGQMMNDAYLPRAGLIRGKTVSVANVIKCRALEPAPRSGDRLVGAARFKAVNKLPPLKVQNQAAAHCMAAHFRVPTCVTLIVAQGALAFRALGNRESILKWRGYLAPEPYTVEAE